MVNIAGNEIRRNGDVVGYIDGNYIRDNENNRLGYFDENQNYVYDQNANPIAYIDGGYLYSYASRSSYVDLDKINAGISGGVLPEIGKCAIYEFLGE